MLGYLSVREMADRTGLSEERIRQLIRNHQIKCAIKLGGWLVKEADFQAFLASRIYESTTSEIDPNQKNGHDKEGHDGNGSPPDPSDSTGDPRT